MYTTLSFNALIALAAGLGMVTSVQADVNLGEFRVCQNQNFGGHCETFNIHDFVDRRINTLQTELINKASSMEWSLPPGTAVVFADGTPPKFEDFPKAGVNFELIGQESVPNLILPVTNDVLATFTVFEYDESLGHVSLFRNKDQSHQQQKIFLSLRAWQSSFHGWLAHE